MQKIKGLNVILNGVKAMKNNSYGYGYGYGYGYAYGKADTSYYLNDDNTPGFKNIRDIGKFFFNLFKRK